MPAYNYPSGMTELVLDTTRAIHNLLWNGTFGKFPNIRWIMPHGGGTVPFLVYRMSAMNNHPRVAEHLAGGAWPILCGVSTMMWLRSARRRR